MDQETPNAVVAAPPRRRGPLGTYTAKLDDKGRIKLPVDFQNYFSGLPDKRFFVTSLDAVVGQIYPIEVWYQNLDFLATPGLDQDEVERTLFNANDMGAEAEMDSAGRLSLGSKLRKKLDLTGDIHLLVAGDRVEIMSPARYEAKILKFQSDSEKSETAVKNLLKLGMK